MPFLEKREIAMGNWIQNLRDIYSSVLYKSFQKVVITKPPPPKKKVLEEFVIGCCSETLLTGQAGFT